jgi:hypothetical protein
MKAYGRFRWKFHGNYFDNSGIRKSTSLDFGYRRTSTRVSWLPPRTTNELSTSVMTNPTCSVPSKLKIAIAPG